MTDWQPLRSAPRDGTSLLLVAPRSGEYTVARWDDGLWDTQSAPPRTPFTLWMPLPAAPEADND